MAPSDVLMDCLMSATVPTENKSSGSGFSTDKSFCAKSRMRPSVSSATRMASADAGRAISMLSGMDGNATIPRSGTTGMLNRSAGFNKFDIYFFCRGSPFA